MSKKYRVHKTYSLDSEVCGRWEELCKSQGKNYSEQLDEYMSREIDNYERRLNENPATITPATLTPSGEFEQTINNRIEPLLNKDNTQLTVEDRGIFDNILVSAKKLVGRIETKFSSLRIVRFSKISGLNSFENDRLSGLETAKKFREQKDRFDLMQELPLSVEEVERQYNGQIDPLNEAQLWELQQSEERRRKKLRTPDKPPLTTNDTPIVEED